MKTTLKCAHCGAEVTELTFKSSKWQALWFVPLILLSLYPAYRMLYTPDPQKHLSIEQAVYQGTEDLMYVRGIIRNSGSSTWIGVEVEAEFFDEAGNFIDENETMLGGEIRPQDVEHFQIRFQSNSDKILEAGVTMRASVSGGRPKL
jgi:hypothetical protein